MTTTGLALKTALSDAAPLGALLDGSLQPEGARLERQQVNILAAFRSMCRRLDYDVCEMAVVTYFAARHYGIAMTAIPVFPLANLVGRPNIFAVNVQAGIASGKDLEGRRVGVRSYTLTPGTWARSVLRDHLGVDTDKVTWVLNDEEHVEQFHAVTPPNVQRLVGADLAKMLSEGEIDAGIMLTRDAPPPNVALAFEEARLAAQEAFRRDGIVPVDHTVVVRTALLQEHPWLARAVFEAMKQAKAEWRARTPGAPPEGDLLNDPMPIGFARTRATLERLMQLAVEQHILPRPLAIEELFPGRLE